MKRTVHLALRLAVTVVGMLWCGLQAAQSEDHVFANLPMLSSREGRLDVDLIASPGEYTINGYQFQGMLYNGAYIPPVWRVRLGDILTVTLHNRLSEPTNLHFHGLGVTFSDPPMKNGKPGSAKMIIPFTNPEIVGRFVFHVVKHEDRGMMQTIEVRP